MKPLVRSPTFALHALAKETLEQTLAVLADSGASVGVNGEGVRHLDPTQHHLLHPDRPAAPGQDRSSAQDATARGASGSLCVGHTSSDKAKNKKCLWSYIGALDGPLCSYFEISN